MQATMDETARRRAKQAAYNEKNHIVPKSVEKSDEFLLADILDRKIGQNNPAAPADRHSYQMPEIPATIAAEPDIHLLNVEQLRLQSKTLRKEIDKAVRQLDFDAAAVLRDRLFEVEKRIKEY